jgi:transketolase
MPLLSAEETTFEFGKGRAVRMGSDLTIMATGETVWPALQAAQKLKIEANKETTVISMHTIKPLDYDLLHQFASNGKPIITVEEHSVYGGMGKACASYLMQNGFNNKFKIVAFPDEYTVTGSQVEIFDHYGLSEGGIALEALNFLKS